MAPLNQVLDVNINIEDEINDGAGEYELGLNNQENLNPMDKPIYKPQFLKSNPSSGGSASSDEVPSPVTLPDTTNRLKQRFNKDFKRIAKITGSTKISDEGSNQESQESQVPVQPIQAPSNILPNLLPSHAYGHNRALSQQPSSSSYFPSLPRYRPSSANHNRTSSSHSLQPDYFAHRRYSNGYEESLHQRNLSIDSTYNDSDSPTARRQQRKYGQLTPNNELPARRINSIERPRSFHSYSPDRSLQSTPKLDPSPPLSTSSSTRTFQALTLDYMSMRKALKLIEERIILHDQIIANNPELSRQFPTPPSSPNSRSTQTVREDGTGGERDTETQAQTQAQTETETERDTETETQAQTQTETETTPTDIHPTHPLSTHPAHHPALTKRFTRYTFLSLITLLSFYL